MKNNVLAFIAQYLRENAYFSKLVYLMFENNLGCDFVFSHWIWILPVKILFKFALRHNESDTYYV